MSSSASASAFVPVDPARTFATLTPSDPTRFYPRFGPIPAVVGVDASSSDWDRVGLRRTLRLSDGASVVETITRVDDPDRFCYRLTEFTGVFGALVAHADADWRFEPEGSGTRIVWRYSYTAKPGRALPVGLIVRLFWAPYMQRVLPGLVVEARRVASR